MTNKEIQDDFPVTLQTFLSYTNVWINAAQRMSLFHRLQDYCVHEDQVPYKKKKKEPYTRHINAPVGRIFGLSCGDESWGIVKTKKAQHIDSSFREEKMLQTMLTGESEIKDTFKNTLSIYISMPKNNVHVMRFSDILKIAGCKKIEECIAVVALLWRHIEPYTDCYTIMHSEGEDPNLIKHIMDPSMINLNFSAEYTIDREKFLTVIETRYKDKIQDAGWQDTQNNILVTFNQKFQSEREYTTLFFKKGELMRLMIAPISWKELREIRELIYAYNPKASRKTEKKIKPIRIKVNRTSTVMATGRYLNEIMYNCYLIMNVLTENKEEIVEKLRPINDLDKNFDINNFLV